MPKKGQLPGFYEKRALLFSKKASPEKTKQLGKQFMDAGRFDDALEFFARAKAEDMVREIARTALDTGDAPLYMRARKILGDDAKEAEWNKLADNAVKHGRFAMAYVAKLKAGKPEEAEQFLARIPTVEPPESPAGPSEAGEVPAEGQ